MKRYSEQEIKNVVRAIYDEVFASAPLEDGVFLDAQTREFEIQATQTLFIGELFKARALAKYKKTGSMSDEDLNRLMLMAARRQKAARRIK